MDCCAYALRHYADFRGRCPRKPFWIFVSVSQLIVILLFTPFLLAVTSLYIPLLVEQPDFPLLMESLSETGCWDEENLSALADMSRDVSAELVERLMEEHIVSLICAAAATLAGILLVVPTLAVTVRRLRDAGQSPWWVYLSLLMFVPLPGVSDVGALLSLVVFILCWLPSVPVTPDKTPA